MGMDTVLTGSAQAVGVESQAQALEPDGPVFINRSCYSSATNPSLCHFAPRSLGFFIYKMRMIIVLTHPSDMRY